MVLIRVALTVFVLHQNVSFPSLEQQLSCVKVSGLQHPSETAVASMAQFHVKTEEQIAGALRWSVGFLASSVSAVPMGSERKDMSPLGSDLVRQTNLVTADEI